MLPFTEWAVVLAIAFVASPFYLRAAIAGFDFTFRGAPLGFAIGYPLAQAWDHFIRGGPAMPLTGSFLVFFPLLALSVTILLLFAQDSAGVLHWLYPAYLAQGM